MFASNAKVSDKNKEKPKFPPCSVCKGQHALWNCTVFKEKNATQRAKHVAEQKLCFSCLQSNHSFRNCSKARKCPKADCESTHNVLLHGAEKIFPPKDTKSYPASGNANTKHVLTNAAVGDFHSQESTKVILPVASLAVSSDATFTNALALCLEQSLNARPITAVYICQHSSNPLDLEALTPNHFILVQHAASFPSLSFEENFDHKKRFARAQSYANAIWTRWMR